MRIPTEKIQNNEATYGLAEDIAIAKAEAFKPIWWNILEQFQKQGMPISEILQSLYLALLDTVEPGDNALWDKSIDLVVQASHKAYDAEKLDRENNKLMNDLKNRISKNQ